jgi:hypothetical protein
LLLERVELLFEFEGEFLVAETLFLDLEDLGTGQFHVLVEEDVLLFELAYHLLEFVVF